MPSEPKAYPKTSLNKLTRLPARGTYDHATIHALINACPMLHVSFVDPQHEFPVVLPMIGCMGRFVEGEEQEESDVEDVQDVYIHGWVSGRLFRKSKEARGEGDSEGEAEGGGEGEQGGLPVTISASFLDGLVLSLTPFHNSCNYRTATLYGHASLVTSPAERLYAMRLITNNLLPTRWENSRVPPTDTELKSTSILRVRVVSASAKIRTGGPSEDREDLKDKGVVEGTWTGVVPYWGTWGEPVAAEGNGYKGKGGDGEVEEYVERWRVGETGRARRYAFEAIEKKGK